MKLQNKEGGETIKAEEAKTDDKSVSDIVKCEQRCQMSALLHTEINEVQEMYHDLE